jgi:hypothetical protein
MVNEVPAITFNAAGVHDHTLERYGLDPSAARQQAEHGLVRSYHVRNELLTHLQEHSIPLKWAMPDAAGHAIELPDPEPLDVFERLVPGRMLMHRLDLHFIDSVMQAQDLAQPQASARGVGATPRAGGDACTSNRLLVDAVGGLAAQRSQLGLADQERLLNAAAGMAARARLDGLQHIDHVVASVRGDGVFAVQGALSDPAHRRSQVELELVARTPARDSAGVLRAQDALQANVQQPEARQHHAVLA